jgi:hypothetical protein
MNLIIATIFVSAILLLLIGVAWLATCIADAIDRKVEAVLHEHDHEMISGRVP